MEKVVIKCPGCGVHLEVRNNRNEALKSFACPECKKRIAIRFRDDDPAPQTAIPGQPTAGDSAATQLGAKSPGGAETQLSGNTTPAATQRGAQPEDGDGNNKVLCRLVCGGREYPLPPGTSIVGRRATKQQADVMLDVQDRYMSRQHITITVNRLVGGSVRASVRNYKNTNVTLVAGLPLNNDDEVFVANGTVIKLGDTEVVVKI